MSVAVADEARLVHALPGRVRVHCPGISGCDPRSVETDLRGLSGVHEAQANPITENVLVHFNPHLIDADAIVAAVRRLVQSVRYEDIQTSPMAHARGPRVIASGRGTTKRARIAVRGLDRDPNLAGRVVERLQSHPGVHARANPLTGRVLVEFDEHQTDIRDLLSAVVDVELPDLPGEDNPSHPLDPAPLLQSAARTVGAGLGLSLLTAQQVAGVQVASPGAARAAGLIGILQGFPFTRNGLRALLGRDLSDLVLSGVGIVTLALAGSPLGLALTGAEALRLLTEVVARRAAWRRYEEHLLGMADATPGATIRLEAGQRAPLDAAVIEGSGTAMGRDGLPISIAPGSTIPAGARLQGGPFVVELQGGRPFMPRLRPAPPSPSLPDRYQQVLGPLSLAYAAATGLITRSPARAFEALLLVNPRTALVGAEAASTGASARVLRSGVVVVGTRPDRPIRRPDVLLVDELRVLIDGMELTGVVPLVEADAAEMQNAAAAVSAAAGSPWGSAFRNAGRAQAQEGAFDGTTARATLNGMPYTLGPLQHGDVIPATERLRERAGTLLVLRGGHTPRPLALFTLRPRLAPGVSDLVAVCRRHDVKIGVLSGPGITEAARACAGRAGIPLLHEHDIAAGVRSRQQEGALVAVLSDSVHAAEAFAACDLAIAFTSGRSSRFAARADLLAPDLAAVAAIVEAGARRDATARDSVALSLLANVAGAILSWRAGTGLVRASIAGNLTALAALADGWIRLRGGERPRSSVARLADPRPERWARRGVDDVLQTLHTSEQGLTTAQAMERRQAAPPARRRNELLRDLLDQIRSPLTGILAAGATLSLVLGSPLDFVLIAAMIGVNVAVGAWQEHRAGQTAATLERLGAATARVLRDGSATTLPATELVPGDVLLLAPGDRVAADALLLEAQNLEVDEAALTGESLPVAKTANGGAEANRIVLEGSDVTVGTGRAVVVAVGHGTRMGATAAALALDETAQSPLGARLSRMLQQVLPLAGIGGAVVVGAGLLRGRPLLPQLAIGTSIAIAAVPEGLPLLAGVGQAAVASRLAQRKALVRRLTAVEALGRVDVACTDKTGTLTEGRLALTAVAGLDAAEANPAASGELPDELRDILRAAALASPHPEAEDAASHPTDVAVVTAAQRAGLGPDLLVARTAESPFDPSRAFHAAVAGGRIWVKGATEAVAPRCTAVSRGGSDRPLDEEGRQHLHARADELAGRGLRVLMVAVAALDAPPDAEAYGNQAVEDPNGLVALGFVGISDPLRPDVPDAVRRCHEAGIRVIMLTGDHPITARAIACQAGLLDGGDIIAGTDIAELHNGDLDKRLENVTVVARVTPLDKLRIVESLQRRGHVVAMTGDGVNDAPALRLADVGVAMGYGGTEVARHAADVVLADDNFATLVEALVEGRSFWRNIRRALGLLLGGNLGELGLVVGASALGLASPLVTRQILAVNLITDALPALAVALQRPAHRNLAALAREGEAALGDPLRDDVLRRGALTAGPALAAYLAMLGTTGLPRARSVAFASIVTTQLAQTLEAGRAEDGLTGPVLAAVAGSAGVLGATLTVPALRNLLLLASPGPLGWALIGGSTLATLVLGRLLSSQRRGAEMDTARALASQIAARAGRRQRLRGYALPRIAAPAR